MAGRTADLLGLGSPTGTSASPFASTTSQLLDVFGGGNVSNGHSVVNGHTVGNSNGTAVQGKDEDLKK